MGCCKDSGGNEYGGFFRGVSDEGLACADACVGEITACGLRGYQQFDGYESSGPICYCFYDAGSAILSSMPSGWTSIEYGDGSGRIDDAGYCNGPFEPDPTCHRYTVST